MYSTCDEYCQCSEEQLEDEEEVFSKQRPLMLQPVEPQLTVWKLQEINGHIKLNHIGGKHGIDIAELHQGEETRRWKTMKE